MSILYFPASRLSSKISGRSWPGPSAPFPVLQKVVDHHQVGQRQLADRFPGHLLRKRPPGWSQFYVFVPPFYGRPQNPGFRLEYFRPPPLFLKGPQNPGFRPVGCPGFSDGPPPF